MGTILLVLLAVFVIVVVVWGAIAVKARNSVVRNIETAARIGKKKLWVLRGINRDSNDGMVIQIISHDQDRLQEQLVIKPSHPDYGKLERKDVKTGVIIEFTAHRDPVYRGGTGQVSGFLRVKDITPGIEWN